jgi:hypothetical protein
MKPGGFLPESTTYGICNPGQAMDKKANEMLNTHHNHCRFHLCYRDEPDKLNSSSLTNVLKN